MKTSPIPRVSPSYWWLLTHVYTPLVHNGGLGSIFYSPPRTMFLISALIQLAAVILLSNSVLTRAMRLVTHNLRFDSQPNNITVQQSIDNLPDPLQQPAFQSITTEQPWSTRRIRISQHLLGEGIVLASVYPSNQETSRDFNPPQGFQEALVRQVNDLAALMGEDWSWVS